MHVVETITIGCSPEKVFSFFRDPIHLPDFIQELESVVIKRTELLHIRAKPADDEALEWDVKILNEIPNSQINWQTIGDTDMKITSGVAYFSRATGNRGTVVRVEMDCDLSTFESLKAKINKFYGGSPDERVKRALHACKQIIETGAIMVSDASITGKAAQPPAEVQPVRGSLEKSYPNSAEHEGGLIE